MASRLALTFLMLICFALAGGADEYEKEPINYWTHPSQDRLATLERQLAGGEIRIRGKTPRETLQRLLDYLEVPVESQVLVFSKTSAQNSLIFPERPRAIYFSDNCYVGWVQNGKIEVISFDPRIGAVFYLVDTQQTTDQGEPVITRPQSCMNCHARSVTYNVPGGLVRSVFPGPDGLPFFGAGTHSVNDTTPIEHRWGGWYVTGKPGSHTHMGNSITTEEEDNYVLKPISEKGTRLDNLKDVIDTRPYLGGGYSDIVALMLLEHQVEMHNTLVAANLSVQQMTYRTEQMYRSLGEPAPPEPQGVLKRIIDSHAEKIVKCLLFRKELEMKDGGVDGSAVFAEAFQKNRRPNQEGRSLKDFRLYERLFKYRCSYLIYSDAFDHLPEILKQKVYRLLHVALTDPEQNPLADHMSASERKRVREILIATKSNLPPYWTHSDTE